MCRSHKIQGHPSRGAIEDQGAGDYEARAEHYRTKGRRRPMTSRISDRFLDGDLWVCHSLGGAALDDPVWFARLRGLALGAAALTLAASGLKAVGPLTVSDLLLALAVLLMLPRFRIADARRLWVVALAVTLIAIGGIVGTLVVSSSELVESGEMLGRFVVATYGAMLLVVCWRPGLEQITSFGWLWVAGGVASVLVALLDGVPRPPGLTPHPTHLAIISLVLLGVTFGLVLSDRRRSRASLGLLAGGMLFAGIVASGSRAALAAAVVVILLVLVATRNRIAVGITIGAVAIGGTFLVLAALGGTPEWTPGSSQNNAIERVFQERVELGREREALKDEAWQNFKSHPVTGVGFADATKPHNLLLQLGSSAGVLGAVGALMLVGLALWGYALAVRRRLSDPACWGMAAGLSAAVIGYIAANSFQNVTWDRTVWIAIALMVWVTARVVVRRGSSLGEDLGPQDPLPAPALVAAGGESDPRLPAPVSLD